MISVYIKLFYFWLILLPFGYQITAYTGVIEPDKAMALVLIMIGCLVLFKDSEYRRSRVLFFMFLAVTLLMIKSISLFGSEFYAKFIWDDANKIAYFLVPLLVINSMDVFRRAGWLVVFVAITGCVSAFMVSMGLITLPVSVPLEYRISWLPRAKGLFLSTGNLAQYIAFAMAMVIIAPGVVNKKAKYLRTVRWVFFLSIAMGLLATQSRNIFIVLLVSLFAIAGLKKAGRMNANSKAIAFVGITIGLIIPLVFVTVFYSSNIVDTVAGAGGDYAKTSVLSRFQQYSVAWDTISSNPLLGIDSETYKRAGPIVDHIHNMWLQLLTHGGLITIIIMFSLLLRSFYGVRKMARIPDKAEDAMVVTVYFAAMAVAVMFYIGQDKMFWTLLGVATSLACIRSEITVQEKKQGDDLPAAELETGYKGVRLR